MSIDRDIIAEDLAFDYVPRLITRLREALVPTGVDPIINVVGRDGRPCAANLLSLLEEMVAEARDLAVAARTPIALGDGVRVITRSRSETRETTMPLSRVGTLYITLGSTPTYDVVQFSIEHGGDKKYMRDGRTIHPHDLARIHRWLGKGRKAAKGKRPLSPAAP